MRKRDVVIGGLLLAAAIWWLTRPAPPLPGPPPSMPIAAVAPRTSAEARGLPTLAPMLRRILPAVVSVIVLTQEPAENDPRDGHSYMRRLFGAESQPQRQALGAGSGVIIDAKRGLIVTNSHVVRNAEQIAIALSDGRRFRARLVGSDPQTDIAVLRIAASDLSAMPLGNSSSLEIGDYVVAIGNPFGLGQTATLGIVSALGRAGLGIEGYEDFIQTDAAINPGNSGGALADLQGRLVGINTAIVGKSGGSVGIGFAIPIAITRNVANQLIRFGRVTRSAIGIVASDHPADMPEALQGETPEGAMIRRVRSESPAARAGIEPGDVVLAVDGGRIASAAELRARVALTPPGKSLEIDLLRNGRHVTTRVVTARAGP